MNGTNMITLTQQQKFLHKFPCFTKLSTAEIGELSKLAEEVIYDVDTPITTQGEIVDSVYLIVEGTAEVFYEVKPGENSQRQLVAVLRQGEAIGLDDFGLYSKTGLRTASVIPTTKVILLRFPLTSFMQFFLEHSELNENISKTALRIKLIKGSFPFVSFSDENIYRLIQYISDIAVPAGEIIFNIGDRVDKCYLICSGSVEIFIPDDSKLAPLATLTKNAIFGESALITTQIRNFSARAIENCNLLVLDKDDFFKLMSEWHITTDLLNVSILENAQPLINKSVIVYQQRSTETVNVITLKNPEKNSYYQLSEEGWFVYQNLNGVNTSKEIIEKLYKAYSIQAPDFVYDLIKDLIENNFVFYSRDKNDDLTRVTAISYGQQAFHEISGTTLEACANIPKEEVTWINVEGLNNLNIIKKIAADYKLHPLTVGDILNSDQQARYDEFPKYEFMILKLVEFDSKKCSLSTNQISLILGKKYILTFQQRETSLLNHINYRLHTRQGQRIREHGADYLAYLLVNRLIEQYFSVLNEIGDGIEKIEEVILSSPSQKVVKQLYRFKRTILDLQKIVWPTREILNHLTHDTSGVVTSYTELFFKDAYDHVAQVIDMIETYRNMLSGMLDVYLSSVSSRTNEIIRVLTIFSVTFIPISFITSYFGMNFEIPGIHAKNGIYVSTSIMILIVFGMLFYFKKKKWF